MASIEAYRSMTDVPVVITDNSGFIRFTNHCFEKAYGWTFSELSGKTLSILIPENLRDAHNLGFSRYMLTGKPTILDTPLTLLILTKGGGEIAAEHRIVTGHDGGQTFFAATIRPLTGAAAPDASR